MWGKVLSKKREGEVMALTHKLEVLFRALTWMLFFFFFF